MAEHTDRRERLNFLILYAKIVQAPLNPAEFDADDLYAFQAFERAQRSDDQELRDLSARLQAQRQARMESSAAASRLGNTYKMPNLWHQPQAPEPARGAHPQPDEVTEEIFDATISAAAEAAITGQHKILDDPAAAAAFQETPEAAARIAPEIDFSTTIAAAVEAAITGQHKILDDPAAAAAFRAADAATSAPVAAAPAGLPAPAPTGLPANVPAAAPAGARAETPATSAPVAETAQAERRAGAARLSQPELAQLVSLQRLYHEEFSRSLDVAEFMLSDAYGRLVIEQTRSALSGDLAALAYRYLDETGQPLRHRRAGYGAGTGPGTGDKQTITLPCDGSTQTLGDFRGIGTSCLVSNAEFSSPVAVAVKGIKQALLAPGCAIACRTTLIKVKGPAGAVVELEFVGMPDLAVRP